MQVKSTMALAAGLLFAPAVHSFLVVPDMTAADDALLSLLPFEVAAASSSQTLELPCAGCPVQLGDDVSTTTSNHLELAFSIDGSEGYDRLVVNSFELYPIADPFAQPLAAPQVVDLDLGLRDRKGMMRKAAEDKTDVALGYRIDVNAGPVDADQELELIYVDLDIIEVGRAFVDSVPLVKVQLIKNGDDLAIAKIETVEKAPAEKKAEECQDWWCSFRNMLPKIKGGCKGMMGGSGSDHSAHGAKMGMPETASPGPYGHGHNHGPHGHHGGAAFHGFVHMVVGAVRHVILPVIIGIAAGIGACLVGMFIVASLVCFVRLVRGQKATGTGCPFHRRMCGKADAAEIIIVEEEKDGLMENQEDRQEPPPKYDEEAALRA